MSTQHTPGPWETRYGVDECFIDANETVCLAVINRCVNAPERAEELYGNARLIAAAPDLLTACKYALGQMKGSKPLGAVHASSLAADIRIVEEAIAKATGNHP